MRDGMPRKKGGRPTKKRKIQSPFPWGVIIVLVLLVVALLAVRTQLLRVVQRSHEGKERPRVAAPKPEPETPKGEKLQPMPERRRAIEGSPAVCIVIDDVGYDLDLVKQAVRTLPDTLTYAIIPLLPYSTDSARYLHDHGRDVILHCPMEPEDSGRWKPGAGSLWVGMPASEVDRIMTRDLQSVPYSVGINNHMGSRATQDPQLMKEVMGYLKGRGLFFLDSRTTAKTVAYQVARESGVPAAEREVFLDDVEKPGAIMKQLDELVIRAKGEGVSVGIGHLRPATLDTLARRLPELQAQGVRLIPLKEVVE
jgi:uncharacterized protein